MVNNIFKSIDTKLRLNSIYGNRATDSINQKGRGIMKSTEFIEQQRELKIQILKEITAFKDYYCCEPTVIILNRWNYLLLIASSGIANVGVESYYRGYLIKETHIDIGDDSIIVC